MRVYPVLVRGSSKYILINLHTFLDMIFLSSLMLTTFYLLTVDVESYCCTWSRSLTHTHTHTHTHTQTLGRTPLDDGSAHRRNLYLTTYNTHNRQASTPLAGFEPTRERPQTHPLVRATTGIQLGIINSECHYNCNLVFIPEKDCV